MAVCAACGAENPEGARFCNSCAAVLGAPASERRKLATLLFCDMSGSTAMGERVDAESVRSLMLSYFHEMRAAIERHGGTVEKFVGDAVPAVFGVPTAHEDDALRACRSALEMQARLATLNEDLERRFGTRIALRIGLNTGEVVAGTPSSRETFVTGDPVNDAYPALAERAAAKRALLESLPADGVADDNEHVISWYFRERLRQEVPVVLEAWASAHGWNRRADFVRALRAECRFAHRPPTPA